MSVLSDRARAVIEGFVRCLPSASERPGFDLEFFSGEGDVGVVPTAAVPIEWAHWELGDEVDAVGLCLPTGSRWTVGAAVDRAGRAEWFTIDDLGAIAPGVRSCLLVEDLCRLRLGMPTEPPERGTDWYWLAAWLQRVVVTAEIVDGPALDLLDVALAHPGVALADVEVGDNDAVVGHVVQAHRRHVERADWGCLHLDAVIDTDHPLNDLAGGLDLGAFSRWVSAMTMPVSDFAHSLIDACDA